VPGQFQGIAFKSPGITPPPEGKLDLDLAHHLAQETEDPLDRHLDPDGFQADGNRTEASHHPATGLDLIRAAFRAAEGKDLLPDPEMQGSIMISGVDVLVSLNAKPMIQETGGHARVLLLIDFGGSS